MNTHLQSNIGGGGMPDPLGMIRTCEWKGEADARVWSLQAGAHGLNRHTYTPTRMTKEKGVAHEGMHSHCKVLYYHSITTCYGVLKSKA